MLCVVLDTNDRFLRKITVGQSATEKGFTREVRCIFSLCLHIPDLKLAVFV